MLYSYIMLLLKDIYVLVKKGMDTATSSFYHGTGYNSYIVIYKISLESWCSSFCRGTYTQPYPSRMRRGLITHTGCTIAYASMCSSDSIQS